MGQMRHQGDKHSAPSHKHAPDFKNHPLLFLKGYCYEEPYETQSLPLLALKKIVKLQDWG